MKKITTIIVALITLSLLQSCGKGDLSASFDVPEVINDCLPPNPFQGPTKYYSTNVDKQEVLTYLKTNGGITIDESQIDRLKELKLDAITIAVDGATANLDDIQNISAFVRPISADPITDANRGTQIAYSENISAGATSVKLAITGENFVEIYKKNSSLQLILSVLNKEKGATGGTPEICFKTTGTKFKATVKAE